MTLPTPEGQHNIPAKHVEFCKAFARLCKEHGEDNDRVEIGSTIEVNLSAKEKI